MTDKEQIKILIAKVARLEAQVAELMRERPAVMGNPYALSLRVTPANGGNR